MPENIITVYVCDWDACGRQDGRAYTVETDRVRRRVILCPDHNHQFEWAIKIGVTPARKAFASGLSRKALTDLHSD